MYITWSNDASGENGDAANAMMNVKVNFNWYNNEIESVVTPSATTKWLNWYIEILNPNPSLYVGVLRDVWDSWLEFTPTAGSGISSPDTLNVRWTQVDDATHFAMLDKYKTATAPTSLVLDTALTPTAGSNDLTIVTPRSTNICKEYWVMAGGRIRCVAAELEFKRKFVTDSYSSVQNKCDVALDYRKFEFFAGWKYDA
jgi:hypothetical protein